MSANNTPGPGASGVGQRIEEAIELIEMELRHAIAYVNDAVIPQVRRESISAMRAAADTLRNLADRFEQRGNQAANQPRNQPDKPDQRSRALESRSAARDKALAPGLRGRAGSRAAGRERLPSPGKHGADGSAAGLAARAATGSCRHSSGLPPARIPVTPVPAGGISDADLNYVASAPAYFERSGLCHVVHGAVQGPSRR